MKEKNSDGKLILSLLFLIACITAFCIGANFSVINDGFWHIKSGEYILKNGFIPKTAVFSWYGISNNLKWINHEWLFGIFAYLIYSIDGFKSVTIFMGLFNFIVSILVYIYAYKRCKKPFIALICMFLYTLFSFYTMSFRPMMVSRIIILLLCIFLEDKKFIPAIIVLILGVNIQGGLYPLYLFIFGCYSLFKHYKYFLVSFICVMLNPYTYNIYLYDLNLFSSFKNNPVISEWTYTQIYNYKTLLFIIIVSVLIYWLSKVSIRNVIFSGGLIFLSVTAVRQILFLFLLLPAIISPYFEDSIYVFCRNYISIKKFKIPAKKSTKHFQRIIIFLKNKINKLNASKEKVIRNICYFVILTLCFFSSLAFLDDYTTKLFVLHQDFSIKLSSIDYPIEACNYINNHPEIKNSRLFNDYNTSPYLIFRGIPTFVDTRTDIFINGFNKTNSFMDQHNASINYEQMLLVLKKYNIDYAILENNQINTRILKRTSIPTTVYQDDYYVIVEINKGQLKKAIDGKDFFN
ncbi:hypothetical protein [Clostridium hydrogenum]|uniref:hypothetical protein n=1 Tax=Clostridium hydrogenum TaxID=2855764 RepID=UPI001F3A3619|nr:hypothetical protein [Clostridium hydrogenum]